MTRMQTQILDEAFDRWWANESSGLPPLQGEDHEEHTKRISRIAWHNGAYVNFNHTSYILSNHD
jgi:hypothetical protein